MVVDVLFAGIAVADFGAALVWYARLFGRPADLLAKNDEVMWRIAEAGWLYLVADSTRAGHALVTLAVSNLKQTVAELTERGFRRPPIETVADSGRKASLTDPEGNVLTFVEVARSE
ncbi:MAG: VOC family protein [Candidatus Dormiibacterota bacterium]